MLIQEEGIVRMYFKDHPNKVIKRGLTLEQAQAHCRNPETSSSTAVSATAIERTKEFGPWFDGYEEENKAPRKPTLLEQSLGVYQRQRKGE